MQRRLAAHVLRVNSRALLQQQLAHVDTAVPLEYVAAEYCEHEGSGTEDSCAELNELTFRSRGRYLSAGVRVLGARF